MYRHYNISTFVVNVVNEIAKNNRKDKKIYCYF